MFLILLDLEEDEAQLPGLELVDDLDPNPSFSFTLVPKDFLPLPGKWIQWCILLIMFYLMSWSWMMMMVLMPNFHFYYCLYLEFLMISQHKRFWESYLNLSLILMMTLKPSFHSCCCHSYCCYFWMILLSPILHAHQLNLKWSQYLGVRTQYNITFLRGPKDIREISG